MNKCNATNTVVDAHDLPSTSTPEEHESEPDKLSVIYLCLVMQVAFGKMLSQDSLVRNKDSARRSNAVPYRLLLGLGPVIDAAGILAIAAVAYVLQFGTQAGLDQDYLASSLIFTVLVIVTFESLSLYDSKSLTPLRSLIAKVVAACGVLFAIVLGFGFAVQITELLSSGWVITTFIGSVAFLCLHRHAFYALLRHWAAAGRLSRNIALVGLGEQARRFLERVDSNCEPWNRIVGVFDDRSSPRGGTFGRYPVLGGLDELTRFVRANDVDEVVIALPWSAEARIARLVRSLAELPVDIHLGCDLAGCLDEKSVYTRIGQSPVLNVRRRPLDGWGGVIKYLEDRILSTLAIAAFGPLMILIAAAIKLECPGPVFYRQSRYGFNNRVFEIYKFRTMYHDRPADEGVPQATKHDPRITRFGRVLRRTSLDELPQLFNVLEGSMSLIGPRPHAVEHNHEYAEIIRGYYARHRIKPGITGWAQVNGFRGETDTAEKMAARVQYDTFYIENWSLILDIKILIRTALVGFIHPNAY